MAKYEETYGGTLRNFDDIAATIKALEQTCLEGKFQTISNYQKKTNFFISRKYSFIFFKFHYLTPTLAVVSVKTLEHNSDFVDNCIAKTIAYFPLFHFYIFYLNQSFLSLKKSFSKADFEFVTFSENSLDIQI